MWNCLEKSRKDNEKLRSLNDDFTRLVVFGFTLISYTDCIIADISRGLKQSKK